MNPVGVTAAPPSSGASLPSGGSEEPRQRTITPYDFRRPIQLSREHARILHVGFDGFARQVTNVFTSALRTVCTVSLQSIEQQNYAEYIDTLQAPTYMTIFSAEPIPGRGVLQMPLNSVMSCIDRILGGHGSVDQPLRGLSDIESNVIKGFIDRLLSEMRYSLNNILDFEPLVTGVEYSPVFAQLAGASDVVAVATFELKIDEHASRLTVMLPFNGLLPHLVAAAAPAPVSDREALKRAEAGRLLRRQLDSVPVDVTIRFRSTRVTADSLRGLGIGDVVRLSHPASAPLEVRADEATFALATAGSKRARLAALIVGTPQEA